MACFFVTPRMDVKTAGKVIAYEVWRSEVGVGKYDAGAPVHTFSCNREGDGPVAKKLAEMMRDDLASGIE